MAKLNEYICKVTWNCETLNAAIFDVEFVILPEKLEETCCMALAIPKHIKGTPNKVKLADI